MAEAKKDEKEERVRDQNPGRFVSQPSHFRMLGKGERVPAPRDIRAVKKDHAHVHDVREYATLAGGLRALSKLEDAAEAAIAVHLESSLEALVSLLQRDFVASETSLRWIEGVTLKRFNLITDELVDVMRESTELGVNAAVNELSRVTKHASSVTITPRAAVKAMKDKAFWIAGLMKDSLTKKVQSILVAAIKNGEPIDETVKKIRGAWLPYKGDPTVTKDEKQLEKYRLKTIVRTNTIDAYNTGRLSKFRDPDMSLFIQAVRYSAVMDEVTTPICSELDGLLFRPEDPMLDRVVPPNHYNCRSLLVPVMVGKTVRSEDFATRESVGRALDLMDKDFGGEK